MANLKREIEFPKDYNKKKVDSRTKIRSNTIRDYKTARYGGDIREAMADGIDISSVIATEANDSSKSAKLIANDTQNRFDAQINGQDKDNESKDARVSKADGKTYNILKDRLDAMDKKPQQAVDDLEIGGTNLLLKTGTPFSMTGNNTVNQGKQMYALSRRLEKGTKVTLSFDAVSTASAKFIIQNNGSDGGTWEPYVNTTVDTTKKHYVATITLNGYSQIGVFFRIDNVPSTTTITVSNMKLELGSQATDWSPAPQDSHHHQAFRKGTRFFAHRGAQSITPENSLPAIRKAINHAGVEIDIHCTSDGEWMVMHDGTVDRMTNGSGAISSFTYADIRKLRLTAGAYVENYKDSELLIPLLQEALTVCKNERLIPVIEIKVDRTDKYTADNYDYLARIVTRYGLQDEMMFTSFNYKALQEIKKRLPLVEVSYLVNDINNNYISQAQALGVNAGLDVNFTGAGVTAVNVAKCHQAGLKLGVWTTKDDSNRNNLVGMGIDFITTNSLSGELRYQVLDLQNGWRNFPGITSYIEEVAPGSIHMYFLVHGGNTAHNLTLANLPNWATPTSYGWLPCLVRTNNGVSIGSVDLGYSTRGNHHGNHINVGLGWDAVSSKKGIDWVSGTANYHI